ncbi:hypothetical protein AYO21_01110 [Fonsecaea monophora]|uniref:Epoxide hydrolase N-terminal domain-containing protein n=1 Tax=Fonsecaea monophora TaxID=254056 RepID=A0A177FM12_9EURO|nr:hypothetical protein AYO21_01110 [Fonsecaea monophora]OAG44620.1 hypothetical protein AYO21_01110 [Fonsecaea monophora]
MSPITPYKINIPDEKIQRLKQQLALADFPDELPDVKPWSRGTPLADLKRLAAYWQDGFDWRKQEAKLNELPQFMTQIDVDGFGTYDIHFVHQQSPVRNAIPLLFCHGWPGSFAEVTKILPLLINGGGDAPSFHVVVPSMVDYGFSSAAKKANFQFEQHAEVAHKLMLKLGYKEYGKPIPKIRAENTVIDSPSKVSQGGDLGYFVTRFLAMLYPESCKAQHVNMCHPPEITAISHPALWAQFQATPLTEYEKAGLARSRWFREEGFGYNLLHSTKPQTAGYAITASPVSLLAWIYEKLHDWTDGYAWTDDEALTWISIYYFSTAGPAASQRIYYEKTHRTPKAGFPSKEAVVEVQRYIDVPLGYSRFPKEIILLPKVWVKAMGPVVFLKEHETGGHFAAWELPEVLVGDLRTMFGKSSAAYGVVPGKSGFDV